MTQPYHISDVWDSASQWNSSVMAHRERKNKKENIRHCSQPSLIPSAPAAGEFPAMHCTKGWVQGLTPCPEELTWTVCGDQQIRPWMGRDIISGSCDEHLVEHSYRESRGWLCLQPTSPLSAVVAWGSCSGKSCRLGSFCSPSTLWLPWQHVSHSPWELLGRDMLPGSCQSFTAAWTMTEGGRDFSSLTWPSMC